MASGPLGATVAGGKVMRMREPFTRIAIYDGQIWLAGDSGLQYLLVPKNSGAYLSGVWAETEDQL